VLHYGCDDEQSDHANGQAMREQAAERARLIYVALTRAVYRCYLVAGAYLASRSTKESARSVLNWLVAGKARDFDEWLSKPLDDDSVYQHWEALSGDPVAIADLPAVTRRVPLESVADSGARMRARMNQRALRDTWRMASFSSLIAAGSRTDDASAPSEEARPDHDELADVATGDTGVALFDVATAPVELAPDDILAFPRGPAAGECLHRMFELADFSDGSTWPHAIERALHERPAPAEPELAQRLPAMMHRLLADIVSTELVPGMTLASLDPKRRLNEMEFLFSAGSLDFPALRALLAAHGFPDVALEPGALRGFVKGFIDMIVEHEGRFWVIDWKSNHLGDTPEDYAAAPLDEAMASHAYHLQALLYVVALHRYLRLRLADYDYDRHIGGYLYLFVRGVRPDWRHGEHVGGVHARRPDYALVVALDALMDGGAQ
jgi:exodeoxyribonuclease V beta subunit